MFEQRRDYIDSKSYSEFAGPDWPSLEHICSGKPSSDAAIQQEVNEFVVVMQDRVRDLRISDYEQLAADNQHRQKQVFFNKKVSESTHCQIPWNTMGVNSAGHVFICSSPSWIPKFLGNILDSNTLFDILNNDLARSIRYEIQQGRYYYCNSSLCNYFNGQQPRDLTDQTPAQLVDNSSLYITQVPRDIILDFDYTCNFKCPSCRTDLINWNDDFLRKQVNDAIVAKVKDLIIDQAPLNRVTTIRWAGGEPFMSRAYMELFEYIVTRGNTQIQNIVQTNGSMLKSKTVVDLLPYIKTLRISYDAATESTYNKIRVNGNWNKLLDNTKFIIDQAQGNTHISLDFVVQLDNYREIPAFIKLCQDLGVRYNIQRMWNWGTWPQSEFDEKNVWHPAHPLHSELIGIFNTQGIPIAKA